MNRYFFTNRPNWLCYADFPTYDDLTDRYTFALVATPEIYAFVVGLPGIQDSGLDEPNGALRLWFASTYATTQMTAFKRWNGVLRSIEAHLDVPLDDVWGEFIETLEFER